MVENADLSDLTKINENTNTNCKSPKKTHLFLCDLIRRMNTVSSL